MSANARDVLADYFGPCPSHPEDTDLGSHQCKLDERWCVYCGQPIAPAKCNGCGQFLTCPDMHAHETRCEACR